MALNVLVILYITFGNYMSGKTVDKIQGHIEAYKGIGPSNLIIDKFNGMDMTFLIKQVYFVKLIILIMFFSFFSSLSIKFMNLAGVFIGRTQGCLLFESLVDKYNLV